MTLIEVGGKLRRFPIAVIPVALGILAALFWGTGDLISTIASKRVGYYATTVYVSLFEIPILLVLIAVFRASVDLKTPDWVIRDSFSLLSLVVRLRL